MENFLDHYQVIRLAMSVGGALLLLGFLLIQGWEAQSSAYFVVFLIVACHAVWFRTRHVRSPHSMLFLDLSLWGAIMVVNSDTLVVNTGSYAFLAVLVVLFADGFWLGGFLAYLTAWYVWSSYLGAGATIADVIAVMFTVAGMATVVLLVRNGLGRLDADRSQMLGTVSHELRNNLTGMVGITELVESQLDLTPEEIRELVGLARQQAGDATEIVEDLLTVARLEGSTLRVAVEAVDVNKEVANTVRRFVGEGTTVAVAISQDVPAASGDSLRVRQILRNLISNAVRYGGSSIQVSTTVDESRVQITVSDDGDGVPAEDEGTIFLPYRRSTNANREAASVGLGLWICRQLASAMGGTLEYRRSDGRTNFIVTLGVHRPDQDRVSRGRVGRRPTAPVPAATS
jgi:signal transduction histidine kinase